MINVFKAEIFRIFKLKSIRILTIITLIAILFGMIVVKVDQSGVLQNNFSEIIATEPLKEGATTLKVKAKMSGTHTIAIVSPTIQQAYQSAEYDLTTDEQEINLNHKVESGDIVVHLKQISDNVHSSMPIATAISSSDDGSGYRAFLFKQQYGLTNVINGINSTWYTWFTLIIAVIVFAGDFTHKRFKNYLHLVNSRESILVGKFIASFIAVCIIELIFVLFGMILAGIVFGLGLPLEWKNVLIYLLYFILKNAFIISFVMVLSVATKSTATTVGFYLAKGILVPSFLVLLMQGLSNVKAVEIGKYVYDTIQHVLNYGTSTAMKIEFGKFALNGSIEYLIVPTLYCLGYIVISWVISILLFRKSDI